MFLSSLCKYSTLLEPNFSLSDTLSVSTNFEHLDQRLKCLPILLCKMPEFQSECIESVTVHTFWNLAEDYVEFRSWFRLGWFHLNLSIVVVAGFFCFSFLLCFAGFFSCWRASSIFFQSSFKLIQLSISSFVQSFGEEIATEYAAITLFHRGFGVFRLICSVTHTSFCMHKSVICEMHGKDQ